MTRQRITTLSGIAALTVSALALGMTDTKASDYELALRGSGFDDVTARNISRPRGSGQPITREVFDKRMRKQAEGKYDNLWPELRAPAAIALPPVAIAPEDVVFAREFANPLHLITDEATTRGLITNLLGSNIAEADIDLALLQGLNSATGAGHTDGYLAALIAGIARPSVNEALDAHTLIAAGNAVPSQGDITAEGQRRANPVNPAPIAPAAIAPAPAAAQQPQNVVIQENAPVAIAPAEAQQQQQQNVAIQQPQDIDANNNKSYDHLLAVGLQIINEDMINIVAATQDDRKLAMALLVKFDLDDGLFLNPTHKLVQAFAEHEEGLAQINESYITILNKNATFGAGVSQENVATAIKTIVDAGRLDLTHDEIREAYASGDIAQWVENN